MSSIFMNPSVAFSQFGAIQNNIAARKWQGRAIQNKREKNVGNKLRRARIVYQAAKGKAQRLAKQNLMPTGDWGVSVVGCTDRMQKIMRREAIILTRSCTGGAD